MLVFSTYVTGNSLVFEQVGVRLCNNTAGKTIALNCISAQFVFLTFQGSRGDSGEGGGDNVMPWVVGTVRPSLATEPRHVGKLREV